MVNVEALIDEHLDGRVVEDKHVRPIFYPGSVDIAIRGVFDPLAPGKPPDEQFVIVRELVRRWSAGVIEMFESRLPEYSNSALRMAQCRPLASDLAVDESIKEEYINWYCRGRFCPWCHGRRLLSIYQEITRLPLTTPLVLLTGTVAGPDDLPGLANKVRKVRRQVVNWLGRTAKPDNVWLNVSPDLTTTWDTGRGTVEVGVIMTGHSDPNPSIDWLPGKQIYHFPGRIGLVPHIHEMSRYPRAFLRPVVGHFTDPSDERHKAVLLYPQLYELFFKMALQRRM